MSEDNLPDLAEIYRMREEGALFSQLEEGGQRYVLMLYELHPNGTTGHSPVEDAAVAAEIGERMNIGPPDDPNGWGIWQVPHG